jgi:hypothetical protein
MTDHREKSQWTEDRKIVALEKQLSKVSKEIIDLEEIRVSLIDRIRTLRYGKC